MTAVAAATPDTTPMSRLVGRVPGLTPADWAVLRVWLISRVAVLALSWPAVAILQGGSGSTRPWLSLWSNWDALRLQDIARYGYFGAPASDPYAHQIAFFPGFPLAEAIVHVLVRQWTVSGLLVSLVAGGVAVVALGRIADLDYQPGSGSTAALYLVAAPAAIFLAVGYSEALFLAFALPAWLAARNGRWLTAAWLAGGAGFIRFNGIFLLAALAVAAIGSPFGRARGDDSLTTGADAVADGDAGEGTPAGAGLAGAGPRIRALIQLAPGLIPPLLYELYLKARTGDWLAWQHAENAGWQRQLTNPLDTWRTAWAAGFGHRFSAPINFVFQLEIAAVLVGVVAIVLLAWHRRWPELVYTTLTIGSLATSIWYESVPRSLLLLWPIWCGLAAAAARRAWVGQLYLAVSVPVAVSIALLFMTGSWAG
jgi:hypothetical protein